MKIQINTITITDAEGLAGRVPPGGLALHTWGAAESWIRRVASEKTTGGYDKVRFRLEYQDGHEYEGRIDVTRDMAVESSPLADHVRVYNTNRSGRGRIDAGTLAVHDAYEPDGRANAARMLDEYQIGEPIPCGTGLESVPVVVVPLADLAPDPLVGLQARFRALSPTKRAALLGMLAALEA